jgi:hypothetical protein
MYKRSKNDPRNFAEIRGADDGKKWKKTEKWKPLWF